MILCKLPLCIYIAQRRGRKKHAGKQASPFKKPKADKTVDSRPVIDEVVRIKFKVRMHYVK